MMKIASVRFRSMFMVLFHLASLKDPSCDYHYENMSVQYAAISKSGKNDNFQMKKKYIFFSYFCSKHR